MLLTQLRRVRRLRWWSGEGTLWFGDDQHNSILGRLQRRDGFLVRNILQVNLTLLKINFVVRLNCTLTSLLPS